MGHGRWWINVSRLFYLADQKCRFPQFHHCERRNSPPSVPRPIKLSFSSLVRVICPLGFARVVGLVARLFLRLSQNGHARRRPGPPAARSRTKRYKVKEASGQDEGHQHGDRSSQCEPENQ